MVVEACPYQQMDDLTLRLKVQELRTSNQEDKALTRCFNILIDRGLSKEGSTSSDIYQFIGAVFCTPDLPIEVLQHTCRNLVQRPDHQFLIYHVIEQVLDVSNVDCQLLYNLDALMSMISSQNQQTILPPHLQMIHRIHAENTFAPSVNIDSVHVSTTMTDEELLSIFLFHTYADPSSSCRHCLRQTYHFWRHIYPDLRPSWMCRLHARPKGLFSISVYQKWFQEDQRAYFQSLDVNFNETDPWSLENTIDTPFYLLQRTTKNIARFHHLFQVFNLQSHFTKDKGEAKDPFDRSTLGIKNKTECMWSIARLRRIAQPMHARRPECGLSLTSCRKE